MSYTPAPMKLDKQLFEQIAAKTDQSPRLRIHYDLRDSEDEDGQRVLNAFCQEQSLPFLSMQTHIKLLCVFRYPPLSIFIISKVMRLEW